MYSGFRKSYYVPILRSFEYSLRCVLWAVAGRTDGRSLIHLMELPSIYIGTISHYSKISYIELVRKWNQIGTTQNNHIDK